jgi:broad specificity phosphatase PhoE
VDARLQEIGFGVLEGLTYDEAVKRQLSFPWGPTAANWPVEGAESLEDFTARVEAAAHDLRFRRENTAIISHGGVIRALTSCWLELPPEKLWSLTVYNVESVVFGSDGDNLYLERYGLAPEWLSPKL